MTSPSRGSGTDSNSLDNPNSPGFYPDGTPRLPRYRDNEDDDSYTGTIHSCADTAISGILTSISHWKVILFGQLMAVFMATRGSTASYLQVQCGVLAPAFNASLVYGMFFFHFIYFVCIQWRNRQKAPSTTVTESAQQQNPRFPYDSAPPSEMYGRHKLPCTRLLLKTPWWKYLLFAFLDVEANYFTYLALRYSSIKSVTLLDTLAIPAAMISSRFVLKRQYSWTHIFGACVCIFGATITIFFGLRKRRFRSWVSTCRLWRLISQHWWHLLWFVRHRGRAGFKELRKHRVLGNARLVRNSYFKCSGAHF